MAHINKVLESIETTDGGRCADIFARPDGTYGFEEYRRDLEDGRGWFPVGFYDDEIFASEEAARCRALDRVSWLKDVLAP